MPPRNEPLAKRRRSEAIAALGIPVAKMQRLVSLLQEGGSDVVDDLTSRWKTQTVNSSLFDAAAVAVELRLVGGGSYTWEYVDFARALDLFAQESADFAGILRDLQQRKPSTPSEPWEIVVYFDETVPGDPLRLDQRRKFMSFYLAVKDVGPALLKHEFMWLPCAVLRTRIIKTVEGKFSRVLSVFLERLLVQMGNVRDGVYLNALNSLCFFRLGNLLADEDGFRQAYASMGANGMFCCLGCLNVCGNRSKSLAAFDATGRIVDITCVDSSRFHTCTDEDLWEKSDILARARGVPMTKKAREDRETHLGLHDAPHGLLQNMALRAHVRPVSALTHDPTHILFSNGMVHTELDRLVPLLKEAGVGYAELRAILAPWERPMTFRGMNGLPNVFSESRKSHFDATGHVQGFASEILAVVPPLAHMLETTSLKDGLPLATQSFLKLARVVQIVQRVKSSAFTCGDIAQDSHPLINTYYGSAAQPLGYGAAAQPLRSASAA